MNVDALSVVVPVYNEEENILPLAEEICAAIPHGVAFELIFVDDASSDGTDTSLAAAGSRFAEVRPIRHARNAGQSAAIHTGVRAARHPWILTLDGDRQNDPADMRKLIDRVEHANEHVLITGNRVDRRDTAFRRFSSRVANMVRRGMLGDDCPDTGCSLKLFRREDFLLLPAFNHMHRFLPALFAAQGIANRNVPVSHRARMAGESKYNLWNRLWVGIVDLFGVRWLVKRNFVLTAAERTQQEQR